MAKTKAQSSAPSDPQGSMTVFMFQVKGDDATLQQGFRMIESAFEKLSPGLTPKVSAVVHRVLPRATEGEVLPPEESESEEPEEDTDTVVEAEAPSRDRAKRVKRAQKIPDVLKDFDPNASTPTLKEYAASKPISSNFKKYLVICAFFHEVKDIKAIGIQHIYTCFRLLGWTVPDDLIKPFANLAQVKKVDRAEEGLYSINLLGLNDINGKGSE